MLYYSRGTAASTDQVGFNVYVKNTGKATVALSDVTIRYYFTANAPLADLQFACDHADGTRPPNGCRNVIGSFGTVSSPDAKYYLEIGFTTAAGSLSVDATSGVVQARFNTGKNGVFERLTQADHYSFDGSFTSATSWEKITAYIKGVHAWGIEP